MSRNAHLVPAPVHDIIIQLEGSAVQENEKLALIQRLETIRDTCISALNRVQRQQQQAQAIKNNSKKRYK